MNLNIQTPLYLDLLACDAWTNRYLIKQIIWQICTITTRLNPGENQSSFDVFSFLLFFSTFYFRCENDEDKSNNKNLNLHDDNSKVENTVLVSGKASKNPGMVDTLRTPQLRKLTLVVAYSW